MESGSFQGHHAEARRTQSLNPAEPFGAPTQSVKIDWGAERITMLRFAAKLLFQFRVRVDGESGKRRICEERIVVLQAKASKQALAQAKKKGKAAEFHYRNSDGNPVHFEFVGVLDFRHLGIECGADEVWYDIVQRLRPSERKKKLIPPDSFLLKNA
jgi:hypothetical protein